MKKWFLIYCKPKQELRAEENLIKQGYVAYRPTINIITLKSGRTANSRSIKCESLFPRYIFVNVDPKVKSISPILSTYGVSHIVRFGLEYAYASDALIEKIKERKNVQITKCWDNSYFSKGDKVSLTTSGFDNVEGIFCCVNGNDRAMVLIDTLGKEFKVTAPSSALSRIG